MDAKPKIYTERLYVHLTPKQIRHLQNQAIRRKKTVSDIVRELIEKDRKND